MIVNMSRAGDWCVRGSAWFTAGSASASLQSPPSSHPGDTDRDDDESLDDHDNTPAPGLPPANIGTIFQSLLIKIIWKVSLQRTADCRQTKLYRSISGQTDNEEEIEMLIS